MKAIIETRKGNVLTWKIKPVESRFGRLYFIDQKFPVNDSLNKQGFMSIEDLKKAILKQWHIVKCTIEYEGASGKLIRK